MGNHARKIAFNSVILILIHEILQNINKDDDFLVIYC